MTFEVFRVSGWYNARKEKRAGKPNERVQQDYTERSAPEGGVVKRIARSFVYSQKYWFQLQVLYSPLSRRGLCRAAAEQVKLEQRNRYANNIPSLRTVHLERVRRNKPSSPIVPILPAINSNFNLLTCNNCYAPNNRARDAFRLSLNPFLLYT